MADLFSDQTSARPADVILLDYVMTLVSNTPDKDAWLRANRGRDYAEWIGQETYRTWLVRLIKSRRVIMITARSERYREPTLARMREALDGWMPQEIYFNELDLRPPAAKERVMRNHVMPKHGRPSQCAYLALESNSATRAMYKRLGVHAVRVPTDAEWAALPDVPAD